ncbi:MAG: TRAP transporter substrate-binding protein [Verrucomicrobiota bacterium]
MKLSRSTSYLMFGFFSGLVCASLLFSLLKPKNQPADGISVKRLKIAHVLPSNHPVHAGIANFAERVDHHSAGRLQIDIFPNGQLGTETQNLEQLQTGTLDIAKVGGATLGNFLHVAKVFSLPYLFRDIDHYWSVLNGPIGTELLEALAVKDSGQPSGFLGLTYYDAGSRNFYTKKPILQPDDLKGLKIRVMNDPVAIDMMEAMGASAVPIAASELYTALQQGVVDGAENNPPVFVSSRHYEICNHFSFDHHSRIPDLLVIAANTWKSLSEQEQEWVRLAAQESAAFQRQAWEQGVQQALTEMKQNEVTIHQADTAAFEKATQTVRDKYATGDIQVFVERIQAVQAQ